MSKTELCNQRDNLFKLIYSTLGSTYKYLKITFSKGTLTENSSRCFIPLLWRVGLPGVGGNIAQPLPLRKRKNVVQASFDVCLI
jgi:hypothetical protein